MTDPELDELRRKARVDAFERHHGVLPDGFRFYFRRYGRHGGRWRGVDPHGCTVEAKNRDLALNELWWMVAAYEMDQKEAARG